MRLTRRQFVTGVAGAAFTAPASFASAQRKAAMQAKAIAFDAFVIFDLRPMSKMAEAMFGGRGVELVNVWRMRQFEYSWLRLAIRRYANFWQITGDALDFAAKSLKIDLPPEKRSLLMQNFLELPPWPGVAEGLEALRQAGFRLALLSNFTPQMLAACVKSSALTGMFDHQLSTDTLSTYKPDPRAYAMALDAFGLATDDVVFAAFGGWDASGAKAFGYKTFWFNPGNQPVEGLGEIPDAIGTSFADLISFVRA